jgi:hypothetical protein
MNLSIRPHFLGLLLLALVVFGIERLIVTDKEAIEGLAEEISLAIQTEDLDHLETLLHPEFDYGGRDRAETLRTVRAAKRKYKPIGVKVVLVDIQVDGDVAEAKGVVAATVYGRPQQLPIEATLERGEDGAWLLRAVRGGELPR